jgi:hypothetical protein
VAPLRLPKQELSRCVRGVKVDAVAVTHDQPTLWRWLTAPPEAEERKSSARAPCAKAVNRVRPYLR